MERGGFHGYRKLPGSNSGPKILPSDMNMQLPELNHTVSPNSTNRSGSTSSAALNSSNGDDECTVREQDRFMPIANVIRIMRRILPPHAKISDDAKETIQECVSEFISFITGEANERCQQEQRKTITAEDVLWAMSKLGFDDYIEPLTLYLHRYRELEGERGSMSNGSIRAEHVMGGMTSGFAIKRANGMPIDYGAFGHGLHLAQYHNQSHISGHQNGFVFRGYNPSFKDENTKAASSSQVAAAGTATTVMAGASEAHYELGKY